MELLFQMTLSGSAMILTVLLVRFLFGRYLSRRAISFLWLFCEIRLLLPVRLPFSLSVWNFFAKTSSAVFPGIPASIMGSAQNVIRNAVDTTKADHTATGAFPIGWIYTVAAVAAAGIFLLVYLAFLRRVRFARPVTQRFANEFVACQRLKRTVSLRENRSFSTPLTYGTFRPVVLLPEETDFEDTETLRMILSHELEHIRRFDATKKLLLALCAAVHWFNPLSWVMLFAAGRDLEAACDECVIRRLGLSARKEYALALLRAEERRGLSPFASAFAKNNLEFRVRSIMNMKKKKLITTILILTIAFCLLCFFATGAAAQNSIEKTHIDNFTMVVIHDAREAYSETTTHTLIEGELYLKEETVYSPDVVLVIPDELKITKETIYLSEFVDTAEEISYPFHFSKAFSYDYVEIHGEATCNAAITATGVFYEGGSAEITSAEATFSGASADLFSQSSQTDGATATLKISMASCSPIHYKISAVNDRLE